MTFSGGGGGRSIADASVVGSVFGSSTVFVVGNEFGKGGKEMLVALIVFGIGCGSGAHVAASAAELLDFGGKVENALLGFGVKEVSFIDTFLHEFILEGGFACCAFLLSELVDEGRVHFGIVAHLMQEMAVVVRQEDTGRRVGNGAIF